MARERSEDFVSTILGGGWEGGTSELHAQQFFRVKLEVEIGVMGASGRVRGGGGGDGGCLFFVGFKIGRAWGRERG